MKWPRSRDIVQSYLTFPCFVAVPAFRSGLVNPPVVHNEWPKLVLLVMYQQKLICKEFDLRCTNANGFRKVNSIVSLHIAVCQQRLGNHILRLYYKSNSPYDTELDGWVSDTRARRSVTDSRTGRWKRPCLRSPPSRQSSCSTDRSIPSKT